MMPLEQNGSSQLRTVCRFHAPLSLQARMIVLALILMCEMLLVNDIIGGQPDAEARTISLTSTQIQTMTSRILPMLDRADQRALRVRIAAIQTSDSNTTMSYLDPAYQDNPVYAM
jgi:hypothetical protein